MGLFSRLTNNKQESASVDSGYYSADDKAAGAAARSKRASNAGGAAARRSARPDVDPVLPEKKRARRRLVGAIALALAVAIGLPMILDSEPKPLSSDISYQIPSKDKPAEAPAPAVADAAPAPAPKPSAKVDDRAALDQSEEIVAPPKNPPAAPAKSVSAPAVAEVRAHTDEPKTVKAEAKPEPKPEPRVSKPAEPKVAKSEPEVKPEPKPVVKAAPKADLDDDARAMAILEGKSSVKPADSVAGGGKFVVQVASLASRDKVDELQNKLREAGIHSYTQKVSSGAGELTRIRVGPLSKDEAENVRAKLGKIGLSGRLEPTS